MKKEKSVIKQGRGSSVMKKKGNLLQVIQRQDQTKTDVLSWFKRKELAAGCIYLLWLLDGKFELQWPEAALRGLWSAAKGKQMQQPSLRLVKG